MRNYAGLVFIPRQPLLLEGPAAVFSFLWNWHKEDVGRVRCTRMLLWRRNGCCSGEYERFYFISMILHSTLFTYSVLCCCLLGLKGLQQTWTVFCLHTRGAEHRRCISADSGGVEWGRGTILCHRCHCPRWYWALDLAKLQPYASPLGEKLCCYPPPLPSLLSGPSSGQAAALRPAADVEIWKDMCPPCPSDALRMVQTMSLDKPNHRIQNKLLNFFEASPLIEV